MKNFYNDKELLSAYLDGELSQAEKKYLEEKIKTSLELQKDLSDLKKLKDLTASSIEKISDSPFFEARVLASLNKNPSSKLKLTKWIPAAALLFLTIGLMILLKFNPNLINHLVEEQKSNLAGFYKQNLQPLLYAANLTNEDIFNFAVYQQLPLDSTNQQMLKL
ncbi:MAG: anti-sigma factor family protein, partial [Nitrososphaeraceae archaeon]